MARRSDDLWLGVHHFRIRHEVVFSPAWRAMGYSSHSLYNVMRAKLTSTNNGDIEATLETLKHLGWTSPVTLSKAIFELETMGFIAVVRRGGLGGKNGVCSLYRFTDLPMLEVKPNPKTGGKGRQFMAATFDFRRFDESVAFAERALADAYSTKAKNTPRVRAAALASTAIRAAKNTKSLQNLKRATTDSVVVEGVSTTESVACRPRTNTESVACKNDGMHASKAIARIQSRSDHATETVRPTYNYQTKDPMRDEKEGRPLLAGYVRCLHCPAQFRPVDWIENRRLGYCSDACFLARHEPRKKKVAETKRGTYQDRYGRKMGEKLIEVAEDDTPDAG